jgi:hypothetical protein
MWEPWNLTSLWAMACYRDKFMFLFFLSLVNSGDECVCVFMLLALLQLRRYWPGTVHTDSDFLWFSSVLQTTQYGACSCYLLTSRQQPEGGWVIQIFQVVPTNKPFGIPNGYDRLQRNYLVTQRILILPSRMWGECASSNSIFLTTYGCIN